MHAAPPDAMYQLFVGVDIAAETPTVSWQTPKQKPGKSLTIEQTPDGFYTLRQRLLRGRCHPTSRNWLFSRPRHPTSFPSPPISRDKAIAPAW